MLDVYERREAEFEEWRRAIPTLPSRLTAYERAALAAAQQGRLKMEGRRFRCGDRFFSPSTVGTLMGFGLIRLDDGKFACTPAGEAALKVRPVATGVAYYQARKAQLAGAGS